MTPSFEKKKSTQFGNGRQVKEELGRRHKYLMQHQKMF